MQVDYVRLRLSEKGSRAELYNRRMPLWMLRKWWTQNQAVRTQFVYESQFMGLEIILPYTIEGIMRITAEELQVHIKSILLELKCDKAVLLPEPDLWEPIGYQPIGISDCFIGIMLSETVEYIRKYRGIRKKNLHILLWDKEEQVEGEENGSGDQEQRLGDCEKEFDNQKIRTKSYFAKERQFANCQDIQISYILDMLLPELNRMTIATDRPDQMELYMQHAYESTGLIIETMPRSAKANSRNQFLGKKEDIIWIDLPQLTAGYYEQANRKKEADTKKQADIQVMIDGTYIDQQLLGELLLNKLAGDWTMESIIQLKDQYHLTLGKITWKPKKYRIDNPL